MAVIQYIRPRICPFSAAGLPRPRRGDQLTPEVVAFCRYLRRLEQQLQAEADSLGLRTIKAVVGVFSPSDGRRGLVPERILELSLSGASPEDIVVLREFQKRVDEAVQGAVNAFCTAKELLGS